MEKDERWGKRPLILGLVVGVVLFAGIPGAPADESEPGIEENYDYPGAAKIFEARGIRLGKGDGHILLADCKSGTGLAEVWSRSKGQVCFQITGTAGYLTLDLPEVYLVKGASHHTIQATVTVDGKVETIPVKSNTWTSIGEGAAPESAPATLLEFRVSA